MIQHLRRIKISAFSLAVIMASPSPYIYAGEVVYNVSGKHGENDIDGTDYNTRASSESDGRDGGDAIVNPDKHGQAAGELHLNLSYINSQTGAVVGVTGKKINPGQKIETKVGDQLPLNHDLSLKLLAVGGRGGRGGDGGRGQDGGHGRDGRDASPNSPGTDGTDGGDGGDEGASTSGGNAADGGIINLRVDIHDNDLAMLLEQVNVCGNNGGTPGTGHGPGSGGRGGRGGSSCTWQEQTGTRPVYRTETTYNSKGEAVGSHQVHSHDEPVYTTRYESGGSDGRDGSSGRSSPGYVSRGKDSKPGKSQYIIIDESGVEHKYDGPYNLILQPGYKLTGDLNNNGFYEPGESITISNLTVTNSGYSPSPKYQKMILYVSDNSAWIRSKGIEISVPVVLNPGESYTFSKETLAFYLAELPRLEEGLLSTSDTLKPRARVERVERDFKGFNDSSSTNLKIRYPIEITPLNGLQSIAEGEMTRVLFKVKNVSEQTIGAINGKNRRAFTRLRREGGELEKEAFAILDKNKSAVADNATGFDQALQGLKPGEEMIIDAVIGVREGATPYSEAILYPELHLESILKPDTIRRIQYNPFTLRVAQTFKYNSDSDILLVANHSLDDQVLEALKYTAKMRHLKMDIWDFNYYGFFNLNFKIDEWNTFFSGYRNKTIIVMGNPVSTPIGKQRTQDLLSPNEVIDAARRFGIRIFIIDTQNSSEESIARLVTPTPIENEDITVPYSSTKNYVDELRKDVAIFDEHIDGDVDEFMGVSEIQVQQTRLWGVPKNTDITKAAEKLLLESQAHAPETNLFINYTFNPQKVSGTVFKKWTVGNLKIQRSVDTTRTSVVSVSIAENKIQDPQFVLSEEFQTAFDSGLHLDTKLQMLNSVLLGEFAQNNKIPEQFKSFRGLEPMAFADALMKSILHEIVHEQLGIRPYNFKSQLDKETLWKKLDVLTRVANFPYGQVHLRLDSKEGRLWINFIHDLKTFSKYSVSVGENIYAYTLGLVFGTGKNYQVSEVTNELIERLIHNVYEDSEIDLVKAQLKDMAKATRTSKDKRENILESFTQGALSKVLSTNGSAKVEPSARLRGENDQAALMEEKKQRLTRASDVHAAVAKERNDYLIPAEECLKLLKKTNP
ncbi:MAG: hypothetical protein KDD38_00775 [Bdellovibrionales bacterium]|nr:hypothetical protein [Bdellovibrionales bacterium]